MKAAELAIEVLSDPKAAQEAAMEMALRSDLAPDEVKLLRGILQPWWETERDARALCAYLGSLGMTEGRCSMVHQRSIKIVLLCANTVLSLVREQNRAEITEILNTIAMWSSGQTTEPDLKELRERLKALCDVAADTAADASNAAEIASNNAANAADAADAAIANSTASAAALANARVADNSADVAVISIALGAAYDIAKDAADALDVACKAAASTSSAALAAIAAAYATYAAAAAVSYAAAIYNFDNRAAPRVAANAANAVAHVHPGNTPEWTSARDTHLSKMADMIRKEIPKCPMASRDS